MVAQVRKKPATYGKKRSAPLGNDGDFDLSSSLKQLTLAPDDNVKDGQKEKTSLTPLSENVGVSKDRGNHKTTQEPKDHAQENQRRYPKFEVVTAEPPELTTSERKCPAKRPVNRQIAGLTSLESVTSTIQPFHSFLTILLKDCRISKIAQGSFAAILRLQLKKKPKHYTIWKLMPLTLKKRRTANVEGQTLIEDAIAEVKVLSTMSSIHGFVQLRSARVLQGCLPEELKDVYMEWEAELDDDKREEMRTDVDYSEDQYWLLIEMTDAGTDLEHVLINGLPFANNVKSNIKSGSAKICPRLAWDIFWGTAQALQHGETLAEFEHRDLHPGNICIMDSDSADADRPEESPNNVVTRYTNIEVTLIDYTLSRARLEDAEILANSMDKALFEQHSDDINDEDQYNLYRKMRTVMQNNKEAQDTRDWVLKWKQYMPKTNVLWLTHILIILICHLDEAQKEDKPIIERLQNVCGYLNIDTPGCRAYESATEVVEWQLMEQQGMIG